MWIRMIVVAMALPLMAALQDTEWVAIEREAEAALKQAAGEKVPDFAPLAEIIERTQGDGTRRMVEFALRQAARTRYADVVCGAAVDAMASLSDEAARADVRKRATAATEWRERVLAIEALGRIGDAASVGALAKALGDREEEVVASAATAMARTDRQVATPALIDAMARRDRKRGMAWEHIRGALLACTGQDLDSGADYASWWSAHKNDPRPDGQPVRDPGGADNGTTIFGTPITCSRIVIILDTSGSMKTTDPYPPDWQGTVVQGDDKEAFREERERLLRAKRELVKVVEGLPADTEFNIIAYSDEVRPWKKGLQRAAAAAKAEAQKFVESFQAKGTTWTDAALEEAYRDADAYCFYLISDGDPTHEGGEPPADRDYVIDEIYRRVGELSRFHKVKIHTLGFRGANVAFMQRLAEMTGGTYRDIR